MLADRIRSLMTRVAHGTDPLGQRDPEYIRANMGPLGGLIDVWYAPEVRGMEHVPDGRVLTVGTHNGGVMAPDMFTLMVAYWRTFGPERPAYGLAHDLVFHMPYLGGWIARLGAVPAHPDHAEALLRRDAAVLVYPGGDVDAYKPYRERHSVKFGRRKGFIRIAIRTGAPIVPVVSVGAHEAFVVLTDGAELAERLGLKAAFRMEVLPIMLCAPWGIAAGVLTPYLPIPTKVKVRVLPPIDLGLPASAADDEQAVEDARERVRRVMQAALDELVAEGGFGAAERLGEIASSARRVAGTLTAPP